MSLTRAFFLFVFLFATLAEGADESCTTLMRTFFQAPKKVVKAPVPSAPASRALRRSSDYSVVIDISSGRGVKVPFAIPASVSREIQTQSSDYIEDTIRQHMPSFVGSLKLKVTAEGGPVVLKDGFIDLNALNLNNTLKSVPFIIAFKNSAGQAGIVQTPLKIDGHLVKVLALENGESEILPHLRSLLAWQFSHQDTSVRDIFGGLSTVQIKGANGKLRTYWTLNRPTPGSAEHNLYQQYLDFVMKEYRDRIGVSASLAKKLKGSSLDMAERSVTLFSGKNPFVEFIGSGKSLGDNLRVVGDLPNAKEIDGGISMVFSKSPDELLPSEAFRPDLRIPREAGETVVEITRRATKKGESDLSPEVVMQIVSLVKGMKGVKKIVIEVDEKAARAFSRIGFETVTDPIKSFRGMEHTMVGDLNTVYKNLVESKLLSEEELFKLFE